jgi:biopolymer transport protein ExbD
MRYFEVRKPRIEIVPMIDIMLFLLVFFIMMAMNMIPSSGLIGHLPGSATAQPLPPTKVLVEIYDGGNIVVDQLPVTPEGLSLKLKSLAGENTVVTIAGASQVPLQQLTRVMDIVRQAGITQIGLATRNVD